MELCSSKRFLFSSEVNSVPSLQERLPFGGYLISAEVWSYPNQVNLSSTEGHKSQCPVIPISTTFNKLDQSAVHLGTLVMSWSFSVEQSSAKAVQGCQKSMLKERSLFKYISGRVATREWSSQKIWVWENSTDLDLHVKNWIWQKKVLFPSVFLFLIDTLGAKAFTVPIWKKIFTKDRKRQMFLPSNLLYGWCR